MAMKIVTLVCTDTSEEVIICNIRNPNDRWRIIIINENSIMYCMLNQTYNNLTAQQMESHFTNLQQMDNQDSETRFIIPNFGQFALNEDNFLNCKYFQFKQNKNNLKYH